MKENLRLEPVLVLTQRTAGEEYENGFERAINTIG